MHRLVYTVFKTIFVTMMFIFIFDIVFYLYRAFSINQRMETIMTSMQKIVRDNNYLPEGDFVMYQHMLEQLAHDMNQEDEFITGMGINYGVDAMGEGVTFFANNTHLAHGTSLVLRMDRPAAYGDIMVCQTKVRIKQPVWGFGAANNNVNNNLNYRYTGQDSTQWNRIGYKTTVFYYNYFVPCLKYQSVE